MLLIVFAALPIFLGLTIAVLPAITRKAYLFSVVIIVTIQIFALRNPNPIWESSQVVAVWLLVVLVPWGGIACLLAVMPYASKRLLIAIGVPVLYFLLLGLGVVLGDSLGLIPQ